LGELKQLSEENLQKFKEVVSDFANILTSTAQDSGMNGNMFLSELSKGFEKTAESGSLSSLELRGSFVEGSATYNRAGQISPVSSQGINQMNEADLNSLYESLATKVSNARDTTKV
jgi:hypothetical protein